MKKSFFILLFLFSCLFLCLTVFAEDVDEFESGYNILNNRRDLKPVSEEEVQKAVKALEEKKAKKLHKKKKRGKKIKGAALSTQGNNGSGENVLPVPYLLIQVPKSLAIANTLISQGFYTVEFNSKNNSLLLKQGYYIKGIIPMHRVEKDLEGSELYYLKTKETKEGLQFFYGEVDKFYEGFGRFVN